MKSHHPIISLQDKYPDIAREWHPTKNGDITPKDVSYGTPKKYWFLGKCGHEWACALYNRTAGKNGCPYCSGNKVCKENCLETLYPEIAIEWHPTKNGNITPRDVIAKSHKKCWFLCKKGHSWEAIINSRTGNNRGCPYCSNQKVYEGNCLETLYPDIAREWHPIKNGAITPKDVIGGSNKKYWFIGKCGHEWLAILSDRTLNNSSCPYCSNKKVYKGNCLETLYPEIAREWHPTKNGNITPRDVIGGSNKKYWFICKKCNQSWLARINHRTSSHSGCAYCSGKLTYHGNCLETLYPEIAQEWYFIKNENITPKDVLPKSGKKFWFLCIQGHIWKASLIQRTYGKSGCPCCLYKTQEKVRSIFEKLFLVSFKKVRPKFLEYLELDGYNSKVLVNGKEYKIAFEYDGEFHDKAHYSSKNPNKDLLYTKFKDLKKDTLCLKYNIILIRIHYSQKNNLENHIKMELQKRNLI